MRTIKILLAGILTLAGCMGGPADQIGSTSSAFLEADLPQAAQGLEFYVIEDAVDGCEGQLDGTEEFVIVTNGLLLAVRDASAVCLDSTPSILFELDAFDLSQARRLSSEGVATGVNPSTNTPNEAVTLYELHGQGILDSAAGDPNPQPDLPVDPNPQPDKPAEGNDPPPSTGGSSDMNHDSPDA